MVVDHTGKFYRINSKFIIEYLMPNTLVLVNINDKNYSEWAVLLHLVWGFSKCSFYVIYTSVYPDWYAVNKHSMYVFCGVTLGHGLVINVTWWSGKMVRHQTTVSSCKIYIIFLWTWHDTSKISNIVLVYQGNYGARILLLDRNYIIHKLWKIWIM